jgi:CheB methylesterase
MSAHDIFVVGTSAGGVEALQILVGGLPRDLPAAIFIVLHLSATGPSFLEEILNQAVPPSRPCGRRFRYPRSWSAKPRLREEITGSMRASWRWAHSRPIHVRSLTGCWCSSRTETSPAFAAIRAMHIR